MSDTSSAWLLLYYLFIAYEVCIGAGIPQRNKNDLTDWLILETGSVKLIYGK